MRSAAIAPSQLAAWAGLERRNQVCRESLTEFIKEAARNEEGDPVQLAPMHLQWHSHLDYCWEHDLKCLILAHWGSGKSSGFAVPLVAWLVGNDRQRRIKIICNSDEQAKARVRAVRRLMESVAYKRIFPQVKVGSKWADTELFVQRKGYSLDPTIHARGVNTIGIGGRADILVYDDVVDQINSENAIQRKKVRDFVEQTWMSRLEPGKGYVLWIATPWHVDDATHGMMATPGWCSLVQRVNLPCTAIDQEVVGALSGVPYWTGSSWVTPP